MVTIGQKNKYCLILGPRAKADSLIVRRSTVIVNSRIHFSGSKSLQNSHEKIQIWTPATVLFLIRSFLGTVWLHFNFSIDSNCASLRLAPQYLSARAA